MTCNLCVYLVGTVQQDQAIAFDGYCMRQFVIHGIDANLAIVIERKEDDSILIAVLMWICWNTLRYSVEPCTNKHKSDEFVDLLKKVFTLWIEWLAGYGCLVNSPLPIDEILGW